MSNSQKQIVVTGASGHLGNVLCRLLLQTSYHVKALYHSDKRSLEDLDIECVQVDILNRAEVEQALKGSEIVIHCAAIISIEGDPKGLVYKTYTVGLRHVVDVCIEAGVRRLIHVSSVHAVEELPLSEPFDETRPYKTNTASAYDYSKAIAEQYVLDTAKKYAMHIVIVRPSSIVGPYDFKPSELGNALIRFYHHEIPILPPGGYDFVDVRDVAQSIIHAIDRARANEIYILSGQYYSMKAFAELVHEVSGKSVPHWVMPYWILKSILPLVSWYAAITKSKPLFTKDSIDALKFGHPDMSSAKAIKELGHRARPLKESLHDFYHWQIIHQQI